MRIWDYSESKYYDAITTGDYLTCVYGGIIKVLDVYEEENSSFSLSTRGKKLLKYIELPYPPYSDEYLQYFNMDGDNIKDIYFHYAKDWGITIGWGTYIPLISGHGNDVTDDKLSILKKHGMNEEQIEKVKNMINLYKNKKMEFEEINNYLKELGLKVPINDCNSYFLEEVEEHENRINNLLSTDYKNLSISQNQFDALVINRYCRGHIYESLDSQLKSGDKGNITLELFQQPESHLERGKTEYYIFMMNYYEYQGVEFTDGSV